MSTPEHGEGAATRASSLDSTIAEWRQCVLSEEKHNIKATALAQHLELLNLLFFVRYSEKHEEPKLNAFHLRPMDYLVFPWAPCCSLFFPRVLYLLRSRTHNLNQSAQTHAVGSKQRMALKIVETRIERERARLYFTRTCTFGDAHNDGALRSIGTLLTFH